MNEVATYPAKLCKRRRSPNSDNSPGDGIFFHRHKSVDSLSQSEHELPVESKVLVCKDSSVREDMNGTKERDSPSLARNADVCDVANSQEQTSEASLDADKEHDGSTGGAPMGDLVLQWGKRRKLRFPRRQAHDEGEEVKRRRSGEHLATETSGEPQQTSQPPANADPPAPQKAPPKPSNSKRLREGANGSGASQSEANVKETGLAKIKVETVVQEQVSVRIGAGRVVSHEEERHATSVASQRRRQPSDSGPVSNAPAEESEDMNSAPQECALRQDLRHYLIPELAELPKFLLSLSRSEKEDDFIRIKGSKLPQRPRKRARNVEKGLQRLLPGAWLCNVTRERYEVRERRSTKKRPRGLKAMNGVESDSE